MDISQNIKRLRKANGMTQNELAKYLKVVPTTISAWELGRNKPLMDKVTLMADLFGVSTSDIVGDTFEKDDITTVYQQLNDDRKNRVLDFARYQLNEQNKKVVSLHENEENQIHTLAAHSENPHRKYSKEDIDAIESYLDELDAKFDKKNKK